MNLRKIVKSNEFFLFAVIALMCIVFGLVSPSFFSVKNLFDVLKSMTETGILAMGSLVVMISGGIDLSFMAIAVFAMHTVSRLFGLYWNSAPMAVLLLCGMIIGLLLGLFNSIFIAKFNLPPFITTLGTSTDEGNANLHIGVLIFFVIAAATSLLLNKTMLGRSIYCIGGSPSSSERIGFRNLRILMFVYAFAGAIAGSVGIMHASFQRMSNPFDLVGGELNVIAAVVLGGPRVGGGYGNVTGTLLGVLLITLINNSLVMLKIPTFWQSAATGLIIILGTVAQMYRYKHSVNAEKGA